MDTKTVVYLAIGVLMVLIGFYIVWQSFQRQKNSKNNFDALTASGKQPVVSRDKRDDFLAQRNVQDDLNHFQDGELDDGLAHVNPKQARSLSGAKADYYDSTAIDDQSDYAEDGTTVEDFSKPKPSAAMSATPAAKTGVDTLGDTLSSLEHATADIMPSVNAGEIGDFDGRSDLLDSHLKAVEAQDRESALQSADEVISLTLLPSQVLNFDGETVLEVLSAHGLKFGEMNLFHRYEESDGTGEHMFSVMRYSERDGAIPFDLQTLSDETVDGLTFFLPLPHPKATAGLSAMLSLSGGIARDLDANVFDENFEAFDRAKRDDMAQYVHEYVKQS